MADFNFKVQEELLEIAIQIIEDYNIQSWSFGGGTALSAANYMHRMSFDIDIFSEDFSSINSLIDHKEEIALNLKIPMSNIEASPSGITFILSTNDHQLKLDFLYAEPLTETAYETIDVLGQKNITTQTPFEIIAKKLKFREIVTIRDYVDFAFCEKETQIISKIKKSGILTMDRYIEVWDQFTKRDEKEFNKELEYLNPVFMNSKKCIYEILQKAFNPDDTITIAINENFEFLTADIWVEEFREDFQAVGDFNVYPNISKNKIAEVLRKKPEEITFSDIYELTTDEIKLIIE